MVSRLFLLVVILCMAASAPEAPAQIQQEPLEQSLRSRPQPGPQHVDEHTQGVIQRRSAERIQARPHDSRVELGEPPWEYTSPEDADILEGWEQRIPAGAGKPRSEPSPLAKAWQLYSHRSYAAAAAAFSTLMASDQPQQAMNARLGLAYSLIQQGRLDQAIPHLEVLVDEGYRPAETRQALIHALMQSGRWTEARSQIAQLPADKRGPWERRLTEARLLRDFQDLPKAADPSTLSNFLRTHAQELSDCLRPDLFHEIAQRLADAGETRQARDLRRRLLECPLPPDLRLGILAELVNSLPDDEALALLRKEKPGLQRASPQRVAELDALELQVLKRRLATLPPESDARARTAEQILATSPEDPDALSALAWYRFQRKEYAEAEEMFSRLAAQKPGNKDYALGLGYARLNSGRLDTALEPLEQGRISEDEDTRKLKELVYREQAARAYAAADWDRAAAYLEKILALNPEDHDAKEMLAWTRYQQNRRPEAQALMEEILAERPSPSLAQGLLGLYTESGDEGRAYDLADRLAHDPDPQIKASTGGFFFDRGAPITAAQLDRNPDRCYFNADSPRMETFLYYRSKQGDGKFGDLEETALPMTLVYPTELGRQWSASVTPKYLAGNSGPANPQAGRFYRFLDGTPKQQNLDDSLFVVQPDVGFAMEGQLQTEIHVGTTPLNGPVDPTPTFEARVGAREWYIDLHRCNVKDSILSYVGQKDPYSNEEWGRVTRNGFEAGETWPLGGKWWVSGSAGFDYYMGDSVWDNQAVHVDTAIGQTLLFDRDEFSYGLFFSAQHFRRNSDFYTFGHGGYYSPELMTMIGPFVRYRAAACRDYWFDVQASAGWLHQRLDSSPFYPLFDGNTAGFTPEAAANANGEYASDTDDKIGINLRLQGMKLLTSYLAAGGFASVNNSADYTEWTAGIGIQVFFDPQNLFWTRKDMFREFGRCANK
ncbi:MAG: cellulose synthase subunit BcsC-related outer membrane protein [Hyphomicrobiales bacterium]